MLRALRVSDLAIIDEIELVLEPGFNVITGEQAKGASGPPSYTNVFAKALIAEAQRDPTICAITAAMRHARPRSHRASWVTTREEDGCHAGDASSAPGPKAGPADSGGPVAVALIARLVCRSSLVPPES